METANYSKGRSSSRLRQRLVRIFRASGCATTAGDVPQEPVFVPGSHHSLLDRSFSFPSPDLRAVRHQPLLSLNCGSCRRAPGRPSGSSGKVFKKERRVTETGSLYETGELEGSTCPPASPASPLKSFYYHYCSNDVDKKKKKLLSNGYGFSSSSSSDEAEDGFFSSEEGEERKEEESETLFSSKSFSSDSSEFYQHPHKKNPTKNNSNKKTKKMNKTKKNKSSHGVTSNGYRPLVSVSSREYEYISEKDLAAETGFPVVKKSRDPYADFRSSMMEMIVETQMLGPRDLEKLLHSYLSLNSHQHHAVIVKAFSDIWEALFGY